jgi:hypothetical protein
MQGIQAGVEAFEAERREGALPVECDHAGNGAMRGETPILTDLLAVVSRGGIPPQKPTPGREPVLWERLHPEFRLSTAERLVIPFKEHRG